MSNQRLALLFSVVSAALFVSVQFREYGVDSPSAVSLFLLLALAFWFVSNSTPWLTVALSILALALAPNLATSALSVLAVGLLLFSPRGEEWNRIVNSMTLLVASMAVLIGSDFKYSMACSLFMSGILLSGVVNAVRSRKYFPVVSRVLRIVTALVSVLVVGLLLALLGSFNSLKEGKQSADAAMAALRAGDFDSAIRHVNDSKAKLDDADSWLRSPLSWGSRFIPFVGPNRDAIATIVSSTSDSLGVLGTELRSINLDSLQIVEGRLDLEAVAALRNPLLIATDELRSLSKEIERENGSWILPRLKDFVDELSGKLEDQILQGEKAIKAVELAPNLFGEDEPRVYFVALTTPSESRGLGGFMGSWLELRIDDGHLEVSDYGRSTDLNEAGAAVKKVSGPDDWLSRYGDFGFTTGKDGGISATAWQNITLSPYFDSTGRVISELYPQSGGQELDGVFAIDVKTISALLEFAGPVEIDGLATPLTSENAEEFLLIDQYRRFSGETRVDLLETVAKTAVDQILGGELPAPNVIANRLGPLVSEGRISGYSSIPSVQDFFRAIGMAGANSCVGVDDCFMITADNASGNKIDYFLMLDSNLKFDFDPDFGTVTLNLRLRVMNEAPSSGEPSYVIGNMVGLPDGYNRTLISIHSSLFLSPSESVDADGWGVMQEKGLNVYSSYLDVPPGTTRELNLVFRGKLSESEFYSLRTRIPPAANDWSMAIGQADETDLHDTFKFESPGTRVVEMLID